MESENLYFIAIIPPADICDTITAFKMDFAKHFESKIALKVMPHITLKTPFKQPPQDYKRLQKWFHELYLPVGQFDIELKDFGSFRNRDNPVVFVKPIMNTALYVLQKEIIRSFHNAFPSILINKIELKFEPHVTIAYRDLSPQQYSEAWKIYRERKYSAAFKVSEICLLQHDTKKWNIIETYHLK